MGIGAMACLLSVGVFGFLAHRHHTINQTSHHTDLMADWPVSSGLKFAPHCAPYPGKRIVFVTVSIDFIDMFRNWLLSATAFLDKETDQLVVHPHDDEAVEHLQHLQSMKTSLPFKIVDSSSDNSSNYTSRRLFDYKTKAYAKIVGQRPNLMYAWLKEGCTVLYVDIDTVWRKPVFPALAKQGVHSLYVANDSVYASSGLFVSMCTCFLYCQPIDSIKELMLDWASLIKPGMVNQPCFNQALQQHRSIDYVALPQEEFPPGWYSDKYFDQVKTTAVVLHANCRVGLKNKTAFFEKFGAWSV
jgi:hypothetical protein